MVAIPEFYEKPRTSARRFEVEDLASVLRDHAPSGAEEAQDYVDAMRVAGFDFVDPCEGRH
jgi:hypothetical protein